jgi:hypothetical protein
MTETTTITDHQQDGAAPMATAAVPSQFFSPAALGVVVVVMIGAACLRQGAFYPVDAFGVTVISLLLILLSLRRRTDARALMVTAGVGAFALWWLLRAVMEHDTAAFLPLGSSAVCFLAAFLVIRQVAAPDREQVAAAVATVGTVVAAIGLIALLVRWTPLAARVDGAWRLATTLTYPYAAATLFVIATLLCLGLGDGRLRRVGLCLCMAGLVATQSPWDLLALGLGSLLVPRRSWSSALFPMTAGVLAGAAVVRADGGGNTPWWAWVAVAAALALAVTVAPWPDRHRWQRPVVVVPAVALVALVTVGLAAHAPFAPLARHSPTRDRYLSWTAAMDQWRSSKVTGVGPERVYNSRVPVSTYPGFEPDSYLTIVAEGGAVAAVLLLAAGTAVVFAVRRRDVLSSCAVGALVAFAVAGNVDFDWQLPAIGLLGGVLGALASPLVRPPPGNRLRRWRARWPRPRSLAKPAWIALCVAVVAAEMVVGESQRASAGSTTVDLTPPPSLTPQSPARTILSGPDATDPFMLHVGGRYYLYASEGDFGSAAYGMNVPMWEGTKIGSWGPMRDVLPDLPSWASWGATWAPDVRKVKGGWALYYSTVLSGVRPETHCIGAAYASNPVGPFAPVDHPLICQRDHRGSIDARTFVDTDGRLIMYWKSEDNANPDVPGPDQNGRTGVWAQYLSADGRRLLGQPTEIFQPDQPWQGTIVEAPDVIEAWGTYWLVFSGAWYNTPGYGIGVASCQSAFGPCTDPDPQPFLGSNAQGQGPGEPSIFDDGRNVYLLYNPWHSNDPLPTKPRPVVMARIGFLSDGPYLATP